MSLVSSNGLDSGLVAIPKESFYCAAKWIHRDPTNNTG
jgi:hypothetical protein